MVEYRARLADGVLGEHLAEFPAIMVVGPRACGKTTTALRWAANSVRLDSAEGAAFRTDPDAALRGWPEPLLLDEWQAVPEVLGAVKRAVDTDRRPGRFLLTGSARRMAGDQQWPGTGRIVTVSMWPLTVGEQSGRTARSFVDRVIDGELGLGRGVSQLDLRDYLRMALRGGFPEPALQLSDSAAKTWLASYADHVALRDARSAIGAPDPTRLARYLEAWALASASTVHHKTLYDAADITRKTALGYDALLRELLVVDELSAWSTNRFRQMSKMPKRCLVDSGLVAGILDIDLDAALSDSRARGSLIETFVVAQLRAMVAASRTRHRLAHLRSGDGRNEIDVMAELPDGRVIGIEVKSAAEVGRADARHLTWLRDAVGERFVAGIVLHTGRDLFELGHGIVAAPISTLWN